MRRFLVDRASIENVNIVQPEAELEPPPNVVNEFNPNEIVRDPGRKKQINEYAPNFQDQVRRAYILKGPMQPICQAVLVLNLEVLKEHLLNHGIRIIHG